MLGHTCWRLSPGTGAQNEPLSSPKVSSLRSLRPIQLTSITCMSMRQQLAQAVEHARIVAGQPDREGPPAPSGNCSSFTPSTKSSPVAALLMSAVQDSVPSGPVFGSLRNSIASSIGVGCVIERLEHAELPRSDGARPRANAATMPGPAHLAVGRERHLQRLLVAGARERVELQLEPAAVVGAHVHRQRLGDRAEAARLLVAVDPGLERTLRSPACRRRAVGSSVWPMKMQNEARCVERLDHVRVQAMLPAAQLRAGSGQRSDDSAGCGMRSRRRRRSGSSRRSCGCWRCAGDRAAGRAGDAQHRADDRSWAGRW